MIIYKTMDEIKKIKKELIDSEDDEIEIKEEYVIEEEEEKEVAENELFTFVWYFEW